MADKSAGKADGADNLGQSGTDQFPTYQDEKGLKAADADAVGKTSSADPGKDRETAPPVEFNHGEESPQAKAEREEMEKNPPSPTPVQMLPENQDETVKPK